VPSACHLPRGSWLMWIASIIGTNPRAVYMSADMTYTRTGQGWRIGAIVIHHGMRLLGSAP
jgi:hypothetical protein